MGKEVAIPMPQDGSGDVALSTLYQLVPQLFAAEITPLNDSKVTLPVKIAKSEVPASDDRKRVSGSLFEPPSQPSAAMSGIIASAAAVKSEAAQAAPSGEENPFWSQEQAAAAGAAAAGVNAEAHQTSSGASAPPPLPAQVATVQAKANGENEPGPETPAGETKVVPEESAGSGSVGEAWGNGSGEPPSGEQSGAAVMPPAKESPEVEDMGNPYDDENEKTEPEPNGFGKGLNPFADFNPPESIAITTPEAEAGESTEEDAPPVAKYVPKSNPFETNEDFSTLFSKKAEEDNAIPFPTPEGSDSETWSAMFASDAKERLSAEEGTPGKLPPMEPGFGNMIKQLDSSVAAAGKESEPAATQPSAKEEESSESEKAEARAPFTASVPLGANPVSSGFEGFGGGFPSPIINPGNLPAQPEQVEETAPDPTPELPAQTNGFAAYPDPEPTPDAGTALPEPFSGEAWSNEEAGVPEQPEESPEENFIPEKEPRETVKTGPVNETRPEADPVAETPVETKIEQATGEPVEQEPAMPEESIAEPVEKTTAGPVAEPAVEPVADMPAEPVAEPVSEPVTAEQPLPSPKPFEAKGPVEEARPADMVREMAAPEARGPVSLTPFQGGSDDNMRDLEFRAIFSSNENFSLSRVARKVIDLEGIHGCALATPTRMVQASRNEKSRLEDEAREMVGTIRSLAKLTGLPEARSFTLQTDQGTVSLFLEGDCCVSVHHDLNAFGPGVKEKLILIARSIHKLEE